MGTIDYEQFFLSAKFVARVKIVREIRGALEKDGTTDLAREFGFCTACATQNFDRLSARKKIIRVNACQRSSCLLRFLTIRSMKPEQTEAL